MKELNAPGEEILMTESGREAIVRQFIDAYNNFDVEAMLALVSDDISFQNISDKNVTAQCEGKKDFADLAHEACTLFSVRKQTITDIEEKNDEVIVHVSYAATFAQNTSDGIAAGEAFLVNGKSTYGFCDDRICHLVDES